MAVDPGEENVIYSFTFFFSIIFKNMFFDEEKQDKIAHLDQYLAEWLEHIETRNIETNKGSVKDSCYPQFAKFDYHQL